jgi:hypothetical protein
MSRGWDRAGTERYSGTPVNKKRWCHFGDGVSSRFAKARERRSGETLVKVFAARP